MNYGSEKDKSRELSVHRIQQQQPTHYPVIPCCMVYSTESPSPFATQLAQTFTGSYAYSSNSYQQSASLLPWPPFYQSEILHFEYLHPAADIVLYRVGHPVTVTFGSIREGKAFYGLVRDFHECLTCDDWEFSVIILFIEVHTLPGFEVDWDSALVFREPPPGTVFLQPHGFLEYNYEPVALDVDPPILPIYIPPRQFNPEIFRVNFTVAAIQARHVAPEEDMMVPTLPITPSVIEEEEAFESCSDWVSDDSSTRSMSEDGEISSLPSVIKWWDEEEAMSEDE
jgi:hypothetical protein